MHTAARLITEGDPWAERMPQPQHLGSDLIEEGRAIPVARVQAMHEGKLALALAAANYQG